MKIKRTFALLCAICIVVSMVAITANASDGYYFELSASGNNTDYGSWRYKNDYTAADVYPSGGTNISYGARFFIRAQTANGGAVICSPYVDRFNLTSFSIPYNSYAYPGYRQMCMKSYTGSSNYTVSAWGTWYP